MLRSIVRLLAAISLCCVGLALGPARAEASTTTTVPPGGDVQAAIDAANPGDTIQLTEGTYRVSLDITKSITIQGQQSILLPPANHIPETMCNDGGVTGICIHGDESPVQDVHLFGLTVRNYSGFGVVQFNGSGLMAQGNRFIRNKEYGIAAFESTGSTVNNNLADSNGEAGFYFGDSPDANIDVRHNTAINNVGMGIFLRNSRTGFVAYNTATGNCVGILVLADSPGPAGNYHLFTDRVSNNNRACPASEEGPPLSGLGIVLAGADNNFVNFNTAKNNASTNPSFAGGGIVQVSVGPTPPNHNTIVNNSAERNTPNDIGSDHSDQNTTYRNNQCGVTNVPFVCRVYVPS